MLGEFLSRTVTVDGVEHLFAVYLPAEVGVNPPVILFLHGYGESGVDGSAQTTVGLGKSIRENPERWPFLVVFPQKPTFETLWPGYIPLVNAVLASVEAEFEPSLTRRYLTGISQGGNGNLELVDRLDWKFAAMAPICGWADPRAAAEKTVDIPTWIFHGDADEAVPVACTEAIAGWGARFKSEAKVTIYPGVGHNSWDPAYAEALPEWFLEQSNS